MIDDSHVMVDCALYVDGRRREEKVPLADALAAAESSGGFVWVGLHEPSESDFEQLTRYFQLPALAVEDAVRAHQRPKLERYGEITFVVIKPVRYIDSVEVVEVSEVAIFVHKRFIVTVRHGVSEVPAQVRSDLQHDDSVLRHGPGAVLYHIADKIIDEYAEVIDAMGTDIDEIEENVFSGDRENHSERIYKLKREVLEFRRAVAPLANAMEWLVDSDDVGGAPDTIKHYFRDLHDHVLRAADAIEGYDRLLTDVLQAELAQISVRQNEVATQQNEDMRKISAWAAIALVPTAIAGIYGMNFDNMPELHTHYGYYVVLVLIASICGALYVLFRKYRWL
ncbi:MAG TPA: magnesium/cobalt transporter CorA [Mycobacteriales bacterium]|jgi:magnesium transporter|nr:magnesium/cobalt transporter CorA [Mycobacteriales bacterium]